MRSSTFLAVFATLLATAMAWSKYFDNSYDTWAPSRRSFEIDSAKCIGSGGKCFASGECCKGYVCAAFDDLFGRHLAKRIEPLNPEVPGYCVLEKDLRPCEGNAECDSDARCVSLGRNKEKYCIDSGDAQENEVIPPKGRFTGAASKAKLGQSCISDADCEPFSLDGKNQLCCQEVRRFRQKSKTICDRVTPMSRCHPN